MSRTLLVAVVASGLLLLAPPVAGQEEDIQVHKKGMELYRAAKYREALPFFARAFELAEGRYGKESPLLAADLNDLAEVHRQLGNLVQAEELYKRAIGLDQQAGGDGPGLATSLNNLALLYRTQGRLKEAEPLYKRSLSLLEKALGPGHQDVAKGLNNLAILYRMKGDPESARTLQERALAIAAKVLGPEHATTRLYRRNLDLVAPGSAAGQLAVAAASTSLSASSGKARPKAEPARTTAASAPATRSPTPPVPPATSARALAAPSTPPASARLVPPPTDPASPRPPAAQGSPPGAVAGRPPVAAGFAVHLASLRDPAGAAEEWRRLRRLHPTLLQGVELRPPRPVEVPGQGTYYRVAGGAFATRAEAQAACARLRAASQYCTVVAAAP
jgi:tetratricopeptide (TPR) repeat protein